MTKIKIKMKPFASRMWPSYILIFSSRSHHDGDSLSEVDVWDLFRPYHARVRRSERRGWRRLRWLTRARARTRSIAEIGRGTGDPGAVRPYWCVNIVLNKNKHRIVYIVLSCIAMFVLSRPPAIWLWTRRSTTRSIYDTAELSGFAIPASWPRCGACPSVSSSSTSRWTWWAAAGESPALYKCDILKVVCKDEKMKI